MCKNELVSKVAATVGISKCKAADAVDAIFNAIKQALKNGDRVQLVGFGSFSTKKRAARDGRNPHTGEPLKIEAKTIPVFKACDALKKAL